MSKEEREQQSNEALMAWLRKQENGEEAWVGNVWSAAVEWADSHPQWYDVQGDNVPEYGREVIVIGRDGKVFFGHRPNPKEYVIVEGEKLFAKTYGKNGWNWPDIALWLDVEIPDELIDKITTEYFREHEQKGNSE